MDPECLSGVNPAFGIQLILLDDAFHGRSGVHLGDGINRFPVFYFVGVGAGRKRLFGFGAVRAGFGS